MTKACVSVLAGVLGLLAAVAWMVATMARVRVGDVKQDSDGMHPAEIHDGSTEMLSTIRLQAKWNKWAAFVTCLAALAQAFANFLPE